VKKEKFIVYLKKFHMNRKQKNRLVGILIALPLISIAIGLILFALKQNINLFYTPSQLRALSNPPKKTIRIGGYVKLHSVQYDRSGENIRFVITDRTHDIEVTFKGVLPNLFREGQTVVVTGKLNQQHQLIAYQVLAKHDEKYMPKSLSKQGLQSS
jgi:cytochrome c-type biogenesis protein CcmE